MKYSGVVFVCGESYGDGSRWPGEETWLGILVSRPCDVCQRPIDPRSNWHQFRTWAVERVRAAPDAPPRP
jgi:hypothetical protein